MAMTDADLNAEDFLARAPLFARLERRSLRKLAALCIPRDFQPGAVVISEGDTGLGLFIVVSGRVEVSKGTGEDAVRLAVMERGDLLGEMALIDDQPRSASAVALEPTRCLLITRNSFQTLTAKDPEIAWCLLPTLAERIRDLQQRMIATGAVAPGPDESIDWHQDTPPAPQIDEIADDDDRDPLVSFARAQVAIAIAAAAGMRGVATALERFLRDLADTSKLDEADSVREIARELPASLLSASAAGLEAAERVPEQLLERYRRYRDGGERR
jgi:CRP/FNR family cyclic AMP-dependent transcriptional regulator